MEKLNEVAIAKQGLEKQIKDLEKNNKKVEYELKVKKKQYQKILNRSRRIGKHKSSKNHFYLPTSNTSLIKMSHNFRHQHSSTWCN